MANEMRLIDANILKTAFENAIKCCVTRQIKKVWSVALKAVNDCPTVDAVEVVHGRWEQVQQWATKAKYRCSVCGREIMSATKVNLEKYPYCHCGAKMDGGNEDG